MKKKKVVFVVYHLICGGVESALFDLVRLMDVRQYDITVFCIFGGGEWEQKFIDAGVKVTTSYSQILHQKNFFLRIRNSIRARCVKHAIKNGGKGLLKVATGEKYDIIVAYHIGSDFHKICFENGAKSIKYIHGSIATNDDLFQDVSKDIDMLSCFDKIICVSQNVQKDLLSKYHLNNTCFCYNPIDTNVILEKASNNVHKIHKPYICAVGRLVPIKGFVRLISCFYEVIQSGYDINLVIVGEGDERKSIEEMVRKYSLQEHVVLVGYSDNPYIYMKNALFVVCSSYSEGMPVTMMESLSLGIPIVSSYKPVEELFGGLPCGITTSTDDESLTKGILQMLQDQCLLRARMAAMQQSINFDGQSMVKKLEVILENL